MKTGLANLPGESELCGGLILWGRYSSEGSGLGLTLYYVTWQLDQASDL